MKKWEKIYSTIWIIESSFISVSRSVKIQYRCLTPKTTLRGSILQTVAAFQRDIHYALWLLWLSKFTELWNVFLSPDETDANNGMSILCLRRPSILEGYPCFIIETLKMTSVRTSTNSLLEKNEARFEGYYSICIQGNKKNW